MIAPPRWFRPARDRRRPRSSLVVAGLCIGLLTGCAAAADPAQEGAAGPSSSTATPVATSRPAGGVPGWAPTTPDPSTPAADPGVAGVVPVEVEIPDIGVRSDLLRLDVDATGVLVPPEPYDVAGWFTSGPVPGQIGPAIIAGHVDSVAGPGVFYRLEEMQPGQAVRVRLSDGRQETFRVIRVDRYPKTAFPTEQVYGPTPQRALRLITCGGDFDRSRRSYLDNIVVYAVLDPGVT